MIQFTKEELARLRERSGRYPQTIRTLKNQVEEVFSGKIIVPEMGIANWTLYYYCPDCSVRLKFDRNSPRAHVCPCCGKSFSGEPYDSAWWGLINMSNYNAAFSMAIIWLATGERAYADKAVQLLTAYARCYPNYEVHGDIPYNGPGRSGAQTLDEANFQRSFAMAYDLLADCMGEEERALVRDNMLLPGAAFLMEHRHRQLHNHEVIINSAIAVIGILFGREDYVRAALDEKYGLHYQLEHGMLENRMWFEGAFGYHFYALTSFFAFEKFALHTPYSNIRHPNYRKMLEMVYDYLEPGDCEWEDAKSADGGTRTAEEALRKAAKGQKDRGIPMLNDTNYGHMGSMKTLYEFPYRELGGEKLAYILRDYYKGHERDNLEAFLYGAEELEETELPGPGNYHTAVGGDGHTVLRGRDGRWLLFKHDRYGGEHDHYDRLGLSYLAFGQLVSADLGTTGYGARMHYDYYKNTGSHNTVVIGEENQAPVRAVLQDYRETPEGIYVEAEADWRAPYEMPDSFTIVQWSEENYRSAHMRRMIFWADSYFAEVFVVEDAPAGKTVDWVMHLKGREETGVRGKFASAGCATKIQTKETACVAETQDDVVCQAGAQENEVACETAKKGSSVVQTVSFSKKPFKYLHDAVGVELSEQDSRITYTELKGTAARDKVSTQSELQNAQAEPCRSMAVKTEDKVWKQLESSRKIYCTECVHTAVYSMADGQTQISALGPDNPSTGELSYLIERRTDSRCVFAHVIESWKDRPSVAKVQFAQTEGELKIDVQLAGGAHRTHIFSLYNKP